MSPRARVYSVVGACAVGAAAIVVGITAATHHSPPKPKHPCPADVAKEAGSVSDLQRAPQTAKNRFRLGLAYFCAGDSSNAAVAWRGVKRTAPDSPYAVLAMNLLHPDLPRGQPIFEPSFTRVTTYVERLLARGIALQQAMHTLSAERVFAQAARLAPNDADAQVAAAVGLFDKDNPTPAFSHLGPLVRRFPHAQVVRFHLGLLSIWIKDFADARKQLRLAVADGSGTRFAREANVLLSRLGNGGTG